MQSGFLPLSKQELLDTGAYYCDFLLVTGDAYVDHPSFGIAIIARTIESLGFQVQILAQPKFKDETDFLAAGRPRYGVLITAGNIDSMVAHYTAAKKRRSNDDYSPGGKGGLRPDRAASVYAKLARKAFGDDMPIALGGLEASLRRFAHYDYWADRVLPSILVDSGANLLMFGMGETTVTQLCKNLKLGLRGADMCRKLRGTAYFAEKGAEIPFPTMDCPSFEAVSTDKGSYATAALLQQQEQDHVTGRAILQPHGDRVLVQNPPPLPLRGEELDRTYALPYMRRYHPSYEALGGVPSITEVEFSIIHNRGCFGACNFCALALHQGRYVTSRSHESILKEAEQIIQTEGFKGYIHDVGGPTANFRAPACKKQKRSGLCRDKACLSPKVCPAMDVSHSDYLGLLRKLRALPGVKKVFVRSGLRYDYLLADTNDEFFRELVLHHISGQLKVAPEHMSDTVLQYMGKPSFNVYRKFKEKYDSLNHKAGLKQFLVPYLMSSHPGSQLKDAIILAEYLHEQGYMPQQVQDFYPTPGTISTAMYYTGIDPRTGKAVYVPKTNEEKAMQRALLQWRRPEKRALVAKALRMAGREDLIGFGRHCLIQPLMGKPQDRPLYSKTTKPTGDRPAGDKPSGGRANGDRPSGRPTGDRPTTGRPKSKPSNRPTGKASAAARGKNKKG